MLKKLFAIVLVIWAVGALSCARQTDLTRFVPAEALAYLQLDQLENLLEEADVLSAAAGLKEQLQNLSVADLLKTGLLAAGLRLDWFDLGRPAGLAWLPAEGSEDLLLVLPLADNEDFEYVQAFFKKNGGFSGRQAGSYALLRAAGEPVVKPEPAFVWEKPGTPGQAGLSLYVNLKALLAREELDLESLLSQWADSLRAGPLDSPDLHAAEWLDHLQEALQLRTAAQLSGGSLSLNGELDFSSLEAATGMLTFLQATLPPGIWRTSLKQTSTKIQLPLVYEQAALQEALKQLTAALPSLLY